MLESYGLLWYNKEQQVVLGKNIFRLSSRTARCAAGVFPVRNSWYNIRRKPCIAKLCGFATPCGARLRY